MPNQIIHKTTSKSGVTDKRIPVNKHVTGNKSMDKHVAEHKNNIDIKRKSNNSKEDNKLVSNNPRVSYEKEIITEELPNDNNDERYKSISDANQDSPNVPEAIPEDDQILIQEGVTEFSPVKSPRGPKGELKMGGKKYIESPIKKISKKSDKYAVTYDTATLDSAIGDRKSVV